MWLTQYQQDPRACYVGSSVQISMDEISENVKVATS